MLGVPKGSADYVLTFDSSQTLSQRELQNPTVQVRSLCVCLIVIICTFIDRSPYKQHVTITNFTNTRLKSINTRLRGRACSLAPSCIVGSSVSPGSVVSRWAMIFFCPWLRRCVCTRVLYLTLVHKSWAICTKTLSNFYLSIDPFAYIVRLQPGEVGNWECRGMVGGLGVWPLRFERTHTQDSIVIFMSNSKQLWAYLEWILNLPECSNISFCHNSHISNVQVSGSSVILIRFSVSCFAFWNTYKPRVFIS